MVEKSSKSIEYKCTNCAIRLVFIGKDAHYKGNIKDIRNGSQVISDDFLDDFLDRKQLYVYVV